jgi:hypothetical protein
MTTEEKKIDKFQAVVNDEFNKAFKLKINGNKYEVAISKQDIPKITSYKFEDGTMIIVIEDNIYHIDTENIFKLTSDINGKKAAIFNFSNKNAHFSDKRIYWKNIVDLQDSFTQPKEIISFIKSKKLVHAFLEIIQNTGEADVREAVLKIENR